MMPDSELEDKLPAIAAKNKKREERFKRSQEDKSRHEAHQQVLEQQEVERAAGEERGRRENEKGRREVEYVGPIYPTRLQLT